MKWKVGHLSEFVTRCLKINVAGLGLCIDLNLKLNGILVLNTIGLGIIIE
jgi:hypothetical protein